MTDGRKVIPIAEHTQGGRDASSGTAQQKPPQATRLVELCDAEGVRLFHTPDGEPWGFIPVNPDGGLHLETWPLRSKGFRRWLCGRFHDSEGRPPAAQAVQDALTVLEGRACFSGPTVEVFTRVAPLGDRIVLDLGDAGWRQVEVAENGWYMPPAFTPKRAFRRGRGMAPLPMPEHDGDLRDLRRFINVSDDALWTLLLAWLVTAFRPTGPYPVLVLTGEQGSGKSTTARVLKALVDPSKAPLRTAPRDERDSMIAAVNTWVLAFDNLSGIPTWLSDALARLATGGGLSTRELYSDSDEIVFEAMRPVIVTGIDDLVGRHDLLDRSLLVACPQIPDDRRRDEARFWAEFEEARPRILGALLDAVAEGLRNLDGVKLERLPRMADFARWVVACEPALPWAPGDFMKAYAGNRAEAVDLAIENDAVANAVRQFMEVREKWTGTATELLDHLADYVPEGIKRTKAWPGSPRGLSGRLKRAATFLRTVGVEVEFAREPGTGRRIVALRQSMKTTVTTVTTVTREGNAELQTPQGCDDKCDDTRAGSLFASQVSSQRMSSVEAARDARDDSDDDSHTLSETAPEQPPCLRCGGRRFWVSIVGSRICAQCHPPGPGDRVVRWIGDQAD